MSPTTGASADPPSGNRSGTRLAVAILAYLGLNIAIITLAPFRFVAAPLNGITSIFSLRDALLNVLLFVPLGFVHQLARPQRARPQLLRAFVAGLAFSGFIETAQVFAPGRYPSVSDLLTNALGAALGAWGAAIAVGRSSDARTVRAFALDLPLVGLSYLLLPAMWLTGLSASEGLTAAALFPLLSAGWIMASIHATYGRNPDEATSSGRVLRLGSGATLFVLVGLAPAAQADPWIMAWAVPLMSGAILTRLFAPQSWTMGRTASGAISRRFEGPTLRVALVPLIGFAVALTLAPISGQSVAWNATWTLARGLDVPSDAALFRAMAAVATYTAIGYAIAALYGRRFESIRALMPRALGWALCIAVPLEWLRGWGSTTSASATLLGLVSAAAMLGAGLYQLQLRHIQTLLGRR